jgi:hypothetical protein
LRHIKEKEESITFEAGRTPSAVLAVSIFEVSVSDSFAALSKKYNFNRWVRIFALFGFDTAEEAFGALFLFDPLFRARKQ